MITMTMMMMMMNAIINFEDDCDDYDNDDECYY